MIVDSVALVLGILGIIFASRRELPIQVGKHGSAPASRRFTFVLVFPLASVVSIIALVRLVGHSIPSLAPTSRRLGYEFGVDLYIGWVLTFIGLYGIRLFKSIHDRISKAIVIVAITCGPLLMGLGIFRIIQGAGIIRCRPFFANSELAQ